MKKIISVLLSIVLLTGCVFVYSSASGSGKTYYIDSVSGDDSNSGLSEASAFKSIAPLRTIVLAEGDAVLFHRGGIYECTCLQLTCSGTENSPITISAYGEGVRPMLTTAEHSDVLQLIDSSYITISELEITAKNGGGIWIDTLTKESRGITLHNLLMHDIQNTIATSRDNLSSPANARACVMVKSLPARSRFAVNDLTITGCEMYDCGNGISIWGSWNDAQNPWCEEKDIDPIFNEGLYIADCYFHNMDAEALIIGMCDGAVCENCRCIDCCFNDGVNDDGTTFVNAAMWFWGSTHSTIRYCEIAGQNTLGDGMTCDFDSYSQYCTYEYIYSHDNVRFVNNCPQHSGHRGNTIRYCLSVNDNQRSNNLSQGCYDSNEYDMKFYNNTIINPGETIIEGMRNGLIANNIFVGNLTSDFRTGRKKVNDETGESYLDEFDGKMVNNCFWGACIPDCSEDSIFCNPGFTGTDINDPASFRLSEKSKLIGRGIQVDGNLEKDIYGNEITDSVNIGCYAGVGNKVTERTNVFGSLFKVINTILGRVYQFIVECNNRYWLF